MTRMRGRCLGLALSAAASVIAGCQPLPRPFADDKPPAALIAVPDNINIAVMPIEGEPRATANKLAAGIAQEFLKHNIPASDQSPTRASYQLEGRIAQRPDKLGDTLVTVSWRLRDPKGNTVIERNDRLLVKTKDWQSSSDQPIGELAAVSANAMATQLNGEPPKEPSAAVGGGRVRVAVRKVSGAPGDGNLSLARSLAAVLKHQDVELVDPVTGKPDLAVDCDVKLDPVKDGKQHVKIVWRVARAAGGEIGQVAQENDIPRGQLDGPWGDIAFTVAMSAEGGIMQLVDQGGPARIRATTAAAATPPPPDAAAIPRTAPPSLPPVAGNIDSPAVNLPPVNVSPQGNAPPTFGTPDPPVVVPYRGVPIPH